MSPGLLTWNVLYRPRDFASRIVCRDVTGPLKVRDAMSTNVHEIVEDATILAAAKRMSDERVNSLIVRPGGREEPYGILSSSDVVDAIAEGKDPSLTTVAETATSPLVTVTPGVPLGYAARLMKRTRLRHLAVFNGREIVGILSAYDIVKAVGEGKPVNPTRAQERGLEITP